MIIRKWHLVLFSSIQNNKEGKPAWVLSGHWLTNMSIRQRIVSTRQTQQNLIHGLYMAKLDGSAMHKHVISNFILGMLAMKATLLHIRKQSLLQ